MSKAWPTSNTWPSLQTRFFRVMWFNLAKDWNIYTLDLWHQKGKVDLKNWNLLLFLSLLQGNSVFLRKYFVSISNWVFQFSSSFYYSFLVVCVVMERWFNNWLVPVQDWFLITLVPNLFSVAHNCVQKVVLPCVGEKWKKVIEMLYTLTWIFLCLCLTDSTVCWRSRCHRFSIDLGDFSWFTNLILIFKV